MGTVWRHSEGARDPEDEDGDHDQLDGGSDVIGPKMREIRTKISTSSMVLSGRSASMASMMEPMLASASATRGWPVNAIHGDTRWRCTASRVTEPGCSMHSMHQAGMGRSASAEAAAAA